MTILNVLAALEDRAAFFSVNLGFGPEGSVLVKNLGDEAAAGGNIFSHSFVELTTLNDLLTRDGTGALIRQPFNAFPAFGESVAGLAPAVGTPIGTSKFLREDGAWTAPSASGGVDSLNGISGAVVILGTATRIDVTPAGQNITLDLGSEYDTLLSNYNAHVANSDIHIDHTAVDIVTSASSGLDGGGDISSTRTLLLDLNRLSEVTFGEDTDSLGIRTTTGQRRITWANIKSQLSADGFLTSVTAHGATHVTGGGDEVPVFLMDVSGLVPPAPNPPNTNRYLNENGTWQIPSSFVTNVPDGTTDFDMPTWGVQYRKDELFSGPGGTSWFYVQPETTGTAAYEVTATTAPASLPVGEDGHPDIHNKFRHIESGNAGARRGAARNPYDIVRFSGRGQVGSDLSFVDTSVPNGSGGLMTIQAYNVQFSAGFFPEGSGGIGGSISAGLGTATLAVAPNVDSDRGGDETVLYIQGNKSTGETGTQTYPLVVFAQNDGSQDNTKPYQMYGDGTELFQFWNDCSMVMFQQSELAGGSCFIDMGLDTTGSIQFRSHEKLPCFEILNRANVESWLQVLPGVGGAAATLQVKLGTGSNGNLELIPASGNILAGGDIETGGYDHVLTLIDGNNVSDTKFRVGSTEALAVNFLDAGFATNADTWVRIAVGTGQATIASVQDTGTAHNLLITSGTTGKLNLRGGLWTTTWPTQRLSVGQVMIASGDDTMAWAAPPWLTSPLTANLDGGGFNISNVNRYAGLGDLSTFEIGAATGLEYLVVRALTLQLYASTTNWATLASNTTTWRCNTFQVNNAFFAQSGVRIRGTPPSASSSIGYGGTSVAASFTAAARVASGYATTPDKMIEITINGVAYGLMAYKKN